jgi:hypothetical protein
MTASRRGLPACNTEACGLSRLKNHSALLVGLHRAASIWRTRRAGGIAALARVEATIYISCAGDLARLEIEEGPSRNRDT